MGGSRIEPTTSISSTIQSDSSLNPIQQRAYLEEKETLLNIMVYFIKQLHYFAVVKSNSNDFVFRSTTIML